MSALLSLLALLLHLALMLAAAPLLTGLLRWGKARLVGRRGPSPLQPWRDLLRLSRKPAIHAEGSSWLLPAAPLAAFAATLAAVALVPSFTLGMATAPASDLLVLAGLLGLARAAVVLGAMDSGTALGGIGASRATGLAVFAQPAMLLVVFSLALLAGGSNLDAVAASVRDAAPGRVPLGFALASVVLVALAENGRVPTGSPAPLPDYAGTDLALLDAAAQLRLLLWMTLLVTLFVPFGIAAVGASPLAWAAGIAAWAGKLLLLTAALAAMESMVARLRLVRVPGFLGVAILLGLLAAIFLFIGQGFASGAAAGP